MCYTYINMEKPDNEQQPNNPSLLEKFNKWKRAITFTALLGVFGDLDAITSKANAESTKDNSRVGSVVAGSQEDSLEIKPIFKDIKKEKKVFTTSEYKIEYLEGETTMVKKEIGDKKINFIRIKVRDFFNALYVGDFLRYHEQGEEVIFLQTNVSSGLWKDRLYLTDSMSRGSVPKKMLENPNPNKRFELDKLHSKLDSLSDSTIILKALKDAGKSNIPEYNFLKRDIEKSIEQIKDQYGAEVMAKTLDELLK